MSPWIKSVQNYHENAKLLKRKPMVTRGQKKAIGDPRKPCVGGLIEKTEVSDIAEEDVTQVVEKTMTEEEKLKAEQRAKDEEMLFRV